MTFRFHDVIQAAYLDVHTWLRKFPQTEDYTDIHKPCPGKVDFIHVAAQFASYFPTHHFKNVYAVKRVFEFDTVLEQLWRNPNLAVIDIGCGGGAASAAVVSTLLQLQAEARVRRDINLMCIGVDPAENVVGTYSQFMASLTSQLPPSSLRLKYRLVDRPVSESITDLDEHLSESLSEWIQPAIPHVFLMQSNIVSPLDRLYMDQKDRHDRLSALDVPKSTYLADEEFGMRESRSYRQLFAQLPIDNFYAVTVGTNRYKWAERVEQMGSSIEFAFTGHTLLQMTNGIHHVSFRNPAGSYWWKKKGENSEAVRTSFPLDVKKIQNTGLDGDQDWHRVIGLENLELAWARARALLQREVIYDEIEIRLFERNLEANLKRLHQELVSYDVNVACTRERLQFRFVKNETEDKGRPRVLSRIEEEIVSIAIVQELGAAAFGLNASSYAYRPNPRFASRSEFLYEYWFSAYQRYKEDSLNAVTKHSDCKVLNIDIKSYFTEIPQQHLVESVQKEMRTQSARIEWLLKALLCEALDDHCQNRGLSQGGAGSGFYANAYLTKFDSKFGINNEWEALHYRFVDDIVIVIPNPNDLDNVQNAAIETLDDLGLQVNEDKSEPFDRKEYLNLAQDEGTMNCLSEEFNRHTKSLWRTNNVVREQLRQEGRWWQMVGLYRDHLHSIGHFIEPYRLSRKLYQYVENYQLAEEDEQNVCDAIVPPLGAQNWTDEFIAANEKWLEERSSLRAKLIDLAQQSGRDLPNAPDKKRRLLTTRIYFSANRLASLGFDDAAKFVTKILINQPWIIRQPQYVIRGLAMQGFPALIERLFNHYKGLQKCWSSSYLSVIIRAIRHLNDVPETLEDGIIRIAVDDDSDQVLRLIAAETWLMKLDCRRVVGYESTIRQIISEEQSARVRKNFLLLLAKCGHDYVQQREYEDALLMSAMEVALTGDIDELLAYVEPDILRERYYNPSYIDYDDEVPYLS